MGNSTIFVVGANGQLGTALRNKYPGARSADIAELDITNRESVENFDWSDIDNILNAAAFTNVDGAETPEGRVTAWKVNASAVANLARIAIKNDITLLHISSDYVFDGTQKNHTEDEALSPLGVYAQSKAAGDLIVSALPKHYIVRTSWVIGEGNNFVRTMRSLAEKGVKPSVVNDQTGRLTFSTTLADAIQHLLDTEAPYGTYNVTDDGEPANWAEIAKLVYELSGLSAGDVTPISTEEYFKGKKNIAPRPQNSWLDLSKIKAAGFELQDWRTKLEEYIKAEKEKSI